ncbi:hypothetical protein BROUX41_003952 [Berkeleyomyces rouxiae]|uniref:uncharacterized protein n=1 Tax=Berkeleyomyces rouxiae TaxID=2035830 RepID=UPI003B7E566F
MNVSAVHRPLGCLKTALRQARTQRAFALQRSYTSTPTPALPTSDVKSAGARVFHKPSNKKPFAVFAPPPTVRTEFKNPVPAFHANEIARLDPTGSRTALFSKARLDRAKVGDVLMVTTRSGEPFSGAFMQIRRRGVDTAIQLRGNLMKTGVEMWYKIYSPSVAGVDIIWRRPRRARRARLTYLRKPKHDMGSVDHLVFSWKRERSVLRSSAGKTGGSKNLSTLFEP